MRSPALPSYFPRAVYDTHLHQVPVLVAQPVWGVRRPSDASACDPLSTGNEEIRKTWCRTGDEQARACGFPSGLADRMGVSIFCALSKLGRKHWTVGVLPVSTPNIAIWCPWLCILFFSWTKTQSGTDLISQALFNDAYEGCW